MPPGRRWAESGFLSSPPGRWQLAAGSVVVTRAWGYNTCLFFKKVAIPFKSGLWTGSKDSSKDQPPWRFLKKQLQNLDLWEGPSSGRA